MKIVLLTAFALLLSLSGVALDADQIPADRVPGLWDLYRAPRAPQGIYRCTAIATAPNRSSPSVDVVAPRHHV
jgi:hypothetical protein